MTASRLRIAHRFTLPLEVVTQSLSILGKRGTGKTYNALVFAEEMIGLGLKVCIVDPEGVCFGLRSSQDGKKPGLPVLILGGGHGNSSTRRAQGTSGPATLFSR